MEAAATLLANILTQYKFFPFYVQLIIGGIDERPRLFSVDMLGGITEEKVTSTGSGSPVAYGVWKSSTRGEGHRSEPPDSRKGGKRCDEARRATGERVDLVIVTKFGFKRLREGRREGPETCNS